MAEQLTPQQYQAVVDRGGKLLVSAAAGSGKTKVLVDRIMSYLTDPVAPANLDDFLIITYTKAAAAELRGKIADKLAERIANDASNRHLQSQMQRLYLTKISTVHAFCGDLLRDYAYQLDIPCDFRVAEESECAELQVLVLQCLMDEAYEHIADDPDFRVLVDTQGFGRDDRQIPQIVLKLYNSAICHLDPMAWLEHCLVQNDVVDVTDASQTIWGQYLIDDLHHFLEDQISAMQKCAQQAALEEGMEKPAALFYETITQLEKLRNSHLWDDVIASMDIDFGRLTFPKGMSDSDFAICMKSIRENCKKGLAKKLRRFSDNSVQILSDMQSMSAAARGLVNLTKKFISAFDKAKKGRHILDFSDLEHKTLDLLIGKQRSGPTAIAKEVDKRYREVMVDEYQDSNGVQDAIFSAITAQRQNCFMVGDVKQSIYQFRLADPGIFLDKYNKYLPAEVAAPGQGRKVLLSSNFRSSGGVINAVNDVFTACMSEQVGGLAYTEDEMLREGIPHVALNAPEVELYGIDVQEDTYAEEASFVANRISQLLDGNHMVRRGDTLRPIQADDIVILLRSPGSVGGHYIRALEKVGIRCNSGNSSDLLHSEEIETFRAILQMIDNPLLDIPLVAALTSRVFCFTADDLAQIRGEHRGGCIYQALQRSELPKVKEFLKTLDALRYFARSNSLPKLLNRVLTVTKLDSLYAVMPDGAQRSENLQVFCQIAIGFDAGNTRDLSHFIKYLEVLEEKGLASTADAGNTGAVTIMSIHKSKGLEFPVVFLCGLSRAFNRDSAREQVLCDKKFGIGLGCIDVKNVVRYPSIAKRAISAKMISESISEELRVLYVAMTRPKDRLIMTYAAQNLERELRDIVSRMDFSNRSLMTGDVDCPGKWVLYAALQRAEAGAFFALGGYPQNTCVYDTQWLIKVVQQTQETAMVADSESVTQEVLPDEVLLKLKSTLHYEYGYNAATIAPSKQTATQLKGRNKDAEVAENAVSVRYTPSFRMPNFVQSKTSGKNYGNIIHTIMQYISYGDCLDIVGVKKEILRLVAEGYITADEGQVADVEGIAAFFDSDLGGRIRTSENVLREFKFSILEDAKKYDADLSDEHILLQGVVDCALIEPDGITVIDFKTDKVTEENFDILTEKYKQQVSVYADALSRIYSLPIKSARLYYFHLRKFVEL